MQPKNGFTLVELSIVLVILGLLTGGVLTGQSLIHAAELRSVSTQYAGYITAVQTFRDKYFAIPGDMPNAQSYWGIQNGTPSACATSPSTDSKTCNGNGDGKVVILTDASTYYEQFRFWQHLANAGLIEGSYTGASDGGNVYTQTVKNAPRGKIGSSLWSAINYGTVTGNPGGFDGVYDNILALGAIRPNDTAAAGFLKPEDVYNIDMKMDDGKPGTGKLTVAAITGIGNCTSTSSTTDYTATYLLTSTAAVCALNFRQAF